MKISNETLEVLNSFAAINQNILIEGGNRLRTVSVKNNVFAEATVQEDFPRRIPLYNLAEFVDAVGLLSDPEIEFGEQQVLISDSEGNSIRYAYADESILKYPKKELNVPEGTVRGSYTTDQFSRVMKSGRVLNLSRVSFIGDEDGTISLVARDLSVSSDEANPNRFSLRIQGDCSDSGPFELNLEREILNILPGDYDFEVFMKGDTGIVTLRNKGRNVVYRIAGSV